MLPCVDKIKKMLPKTYVRKHVAQDISVALRHFKHLEAVMDKYVYNDGTTKDLMSLTGTIPINYEGKTFNIPVCLWLEESYPQTAPICYVRPTREMILLRGLFISTNGEITLPYLDEWKSGEYDLTGTLQVMVAMFGNDPPVCMQYPKEPDLSSCCLQFHKQALVLSDKDGNTYLNIPKEDGQLFQPVHETSC